MATMEAELQHMRMENTRLRLRLAEAGLGLTLDSAAAVEGHTPAALAEMSKAAPQAPEPTRTGDQPLNADTDSMDANGEGPSPPELSTPVPDLRGAMADSQILEPVSFAKDLTPEVVEEVHNLRSPQRPPASTDPGDVVLALGALLRKYGLHGLPVSQHRQVEAAWTVAGRTLLLRQKGCDLEASGDGGQSWELLEALFVQNLAQLQALKRDTDIVARVSATPAQARSSRRAQSSQDYGRQAPRLAEPVTGPGGLSLERTEDGLPVWRADGLPAFNNAFPQSFDALSGASQYYSQFRVRVPTASQYEASERN
ncbi:unnamed protein product [Symbiodinium microadriaticum]|nr:unnamed protein product [Symbiodinium microadriaticum]